MQAPRETGLLSPVNRSHWIRLRTLTGLRWIAIAGQLTALFVSQLVLDLQINIGFCFFVVGAAVIANMLSVALFPENKRLSEFETMLWLLFDLTQLALLLMLTGGLNNPFALLLLVPVTIAATALHLGPALFLGFVAMALATLAGFAYLPLMDSAGELMQMPDIFLLGFWVAIVTGVGFLAFYAGRISSEINTMSDALLATQMALAREQKLTDLGGIVAAAAHELGTPLATIKLVSSEMIDELSDQDELREDAELVSSQADRCREILHSMGRTGKDDLHMKIALLQAVLEEAAEPHLDRGKHVSFKCTSLADTNPGQPNIYRQPEVIHGLRNLIQNAVDFSDESVWVEGFWDERRIGVRITDDGQGFTAQVLNRIGDPFMRHRRTEHEIQKRPGYTGMGLGLFIAKTLLERTGASLSFANGSDPYDQNSPRPERCGAIVEVVWSRDRLIADEVGQGLGENRPMIG